MEQVILQIKKDGSWKVDLIVCLLFAAAAFLLYSNTFQSPFMFDDWPHIEVNRHIQIDSLGWEELKSAAFESPLRHRPVPYVTLALNYYFHGFDLFGYHLVNILIHFAAGFFLYLFLRTTFSIRPGRHKNDSTKWLPLAAALIWLLHPLHIQSVTYLIQRMNSLASMFYILSMLLYARARLATGTGKQLPLFLGSLLAGILALGSKENAATLPLFILLYEWFFLQDLSFCWLRRRMVPILGVGVLLVLLVLFFLGKNPLAAIQNSYNIRDFTMGQRVLTEFRVVLFYLSLLVFPHPARLNIDHDFPLSFSLLTPPATIFSLGVLSGLFIMALILAKKERFISFAILWFLGNLVIESSVIGIEIIFEHRTYLPSMLAVLALVTVCSRLLSREWLQVATLVFVVALFSTWTFQRNMVWQDEVTLRRDAVQKSPAKPRALAILANALERKGEFGEAEHYYQETLRLTPGNADEIHYNLGNVQMALGKPADAIGNFRRAVNLSPEVAVMRLNLAYALAVNGNTDGALRELQELVRRHPEEPRGHNNLGLLLMKQGKFREAIAHFSIALKLKPDYAKARMNLEAAVINLQKINGAR